MSSFFLTKNGERLRGVSTLVRDRMFLRLRELGVLPLQSAEAAAYSLAMVVRMALGMFARDGRICAVVDDSFEGSIAMAATRHLVNGGAAAELILLAPPSTLSADASRQHSILQAMGIASQQVTETAEEGPLAQQISSAQHLIVGLAHTVVHPHLAGLVELLNDANAPIHVLSVPCGVNPESGELTSSPLYASSTLSLGVPLQGLSSAAELVGRHFLCDVSFTTPIYRTEGDDLSAIFSEQPVLQLFPEQIAAAE